MIDRTEKYGLQVANVLVDLVDKKISPGIDISSDDFWRAFANIFNEMAPINTSLLEKRLELQKRINEWHTGNKNKPYNIDEYKKMLLDIGYLIPEGPNFNITTDNIDDEISTIAGPQLVVPASNARFALNAANARWGSLYDALYGTDVIGSDNGREITDSYNSVRGTAVIEYAAQFLDDACPLERGSHLNVLQYNISSGFLEATLKNNLIVKLKDENKFVGYQGTAENPSSILLRNNSLHIDLSIDREHPIGRDNPSGLKDIILESALTTIQDFEDSVAAVDAEDKALIYENFLGLIKGDLEAVFEKDGKPVTRKLNPDRNYLSPDNKSFTLPGRSLLLFRNVGHLMTSPAILDGAGNEVPEGIMDALFTGLISLHDLKKGTASKNSRTGSIYIVKPKLHGPDEVAFSCNLFQRVENVLGMPNKTIKIGIMDEERRTTINLKECIRAASDRIVFINTGFLDRTGDEIHTSMNAGPFLPKSELKNARWIKAYENWNVDIGLETGFQGKAQIGKGMWAMPDEMSAMMQAKIEHPESGANTAWVPSPTAATLHAIHYHNCSVTERQSEHQKRLKANLDDILDIPLLDGQNLTDHEIQTELDNNVQGILGYVVRWIDQGIGCSKVPDINNIGLMEDRATLRISSQHIANWLCHKICTEEQVRLTLRRMATIVDKQNANDPNYTAMAPEFNGIAFETASALIFEGQEQPSGYTEPLLHSRRLEKKTISEVH